MASRPGLELTKPSTSRNADTIVNVREMVTRDHRWALRMTADELDNSKEMIRQILNAVNILKDLPETHI
jgi:hypothetical protein